MLSDIPVAVLAEVEKTIGSKVSGFSFAAGGCINRTGNCMTQSGPVFLKWNDREKFPGMLEAESRGLSLLRQGTVLHVPKVLHSGEVDAFQFLLMDSIRGGGRSKTYWKALAHGLAMLHRNTRESFGLDHDNYIGSLRQPNASRSSWAEFFVEERLRNQLRMAVDHRRIEPTIAKKFEVLFTKLGTLMPEEAPALLHGDLWGGNVMTDERGGPVLIDPAVYYGHREVDLAMTQLFGGFNITFLNAYRDGFPLEPGFEERCDILNLYPLLVHVNLFGGGYAREVESIVGRFV